MPMTGHRTARDAAARDPFCSTACARDYFGVAAMERERRLSGYWDACGHA